MSAETSGQDRTPEQSATPQGPDFTVTNMDQARRRIDMLEERLLEARGQLAHVRSSNEKLAQTIAQTREQIATLRHEVEKLTQPPAIYGTFIEFNDDGTVDIFAQGRKMRVSVTPDIGRGQVQRGDEVILNETFAVIGYRPTDGQGEVVTVKEVIDERRVLVYGRSDDEREERLGLRT